MVEKWWAIQCFKHHLSTVLNSQKGNKFKYIAKAQGCDNCLWFSFLMQKKKIPDARLIYTQWSWVESRSIPQLPHVSVHLGRHTGPEKVQVKENTPGGWAARWITGSRFVCSFRSRRSCAGLKQWLFHGAASHLPHLQPVMDDGSRGQQTLGAQPLNTLSKMAKGHVLQ